MKFGMINVFNVSIVVLLLLPNLIYAVKQRGQRNLCENRLMNLLEQLGRYGSMAFMAVCFQEDGFAFSSSLSFLIYGFGCWILLSAYWIAWAVYFRMTGVHVFVKNEGNRAVFVAGRVNVRNVKLVKWALVLLPSFVFLLCGITLKYALLIVSSVVFLAGHGYVTMENIRKSEVLDGKER